LLVGVVEVLAILLVEVVPVVLENYLVFRLLLLFQLL
tara:strand:+ start:124 stop:234 length:111 start_codon:yes stop_codon:yes gene_type:complete